MCPCRINVLTPDGVKSVEYRADSLAEAAHYEPRDGVYTITNTYGTTKVLKLDAHLDRLEQSARLAGIPLRLDRPKLRAALRQMIIDAKYGDVRFRITAPKDDPACLILSIEPFKPQPPEVYTAGVRCVTVPGSARHNPAAKTTGWMHDREAVEKSLPPGVYTGLLLSKTGDLLEGISSNFYAILRGELRTAGKDVLGGIAQQIVFEIAPSVLPLRKEAVNSVDIPSLDEAFLTSSSRAIVPVIAIDGITIGSGKPGKKTQKLREQYQVWVDTHLEVL
ncbi:MAG TPA: aminotransferase class IV [Phototrophicaceae bacterium]|nr:aminotransferase class IV [Phototrophicaceae bacterium]